MRTLFIIVLLTSGCLFGGGSEEPKTGSSNNGVTNNGTTNNGETNNGETNNGATNNGATNNGTTNNGTTNNGTTNNGTTNTGAPYITDVRAVQLTILRGETEADANIENFATENVLPLVSMKTVHGTRHGGRWMFDVDLDAENQTLKISRSDPNAAEPLDVTVFLLAIDPTVATVSKIEFSGTVATTSVEQLFASEQDRTFATFYYRTSAEFGSSIFLRLSHDGSHLRVSRNGSLGRFEGTVYAVTAVDDAFRVEWEDLVMEATDATSTNIVSQPMNMMVLFSWNSSNNALAGRSNFISCGMETSNIRCLRGTSTDTNVVTLQRISHSYTTEHSLVDFAAGATEVEVPPSFSLNGAIGAPGVGACSVNTSAAVRECHFDFTALGTLSRAMGPNPASVYIQSFPNLVPIQP